MKLAIIPTFLLPLASATVVAPYTSTGCSGSTVGRFSSCGDTTLRNYNIRSARVDYQGATARLYRDIDSWGNCAGAYISVASDRCQSSVPWGRIQCIKICGGSCSNHC